jgi:acetate kinase
MNDLILTLNAGSSSIKFALYEVVDNQPVETVKGQVEGIGTAPHFVAKNPAGALLAESYWERVAAGQGHARAFKQIWSWLADAAQGRQILAVGHRVGHGGETFADPVLIDARVLEILTGLIPLVPLHQPNNLAAIRAVAADHPQLPQVACFDTGFHRGRPRVTEQLGLPRALLERGVKRYGWAKTMRRFAPGSVGTPPGWGSSWTRPPISSAVRGSAPRVPPPRSGSSPPTRRR